MNIKHTIFATLATFGQTASASDTMPLLACPDSVSITPQQTTGWKVHVASVLYLNSATPISGPPELQGDLANFTTRRQKDKWSYTYNLDRPFPDGKWLECGYGSHNEITLSRRLPDSIKTCTFTYRKGAAAGQHAITIECN